MHNKSTLLISGILTFIHVLEAHGAWRETTGMSTIRASHTATVLQDGTVLIVGGRGGFPYLANAEIFDPKTESWTSIENMSTPRYDHTATMLMDGRVLVVGHLGRPVHCRII